MKKKIIFVSITLLATIFFVLNIIANSEKTIHVNVVTMERSKIQTSIKLPGKLKYKYDQKIFYDPSKGTIKNYTVNDKQRVKKGDILFSYDNTDLLTELQKINLQYEATTLKINDLNNQLQDKKIINDKKNDKTISDQLSFEKKLLEIDLKSLQLEQISLKNKIEKLNVRSEINGTVQYISNNKNISDNSSVVIHLVNTNKNYIQAYASEYDMLKINTHQKVEIFSKLIGDKKWTGTIAYLSKFPYMDSESINVTNSNKYELNISVDKKIPLFSDSNLNLKIITGTKSSLTIPLNLIQQNGNDQFVWIIKKGKVFKKKIEVGVSSFNKVEVLNGLDSKDKIVTSSLENLEEGQLVTYD